MLKLSNKKTTLSERYRRWKCLSLGDAIGEEYKQQISKWWLWFSLCWKTSPLPQPARIKWLLDSIKLPRHYWDIPSVYHLTVTRAPFTLHPNHFEIGLAKPVLNFVLGDAETSNLPVWSLLTHREMKNVTSLKFIINHQFDINHIWHVPHSVPACILAALTFESEPASRTRHFQSKWE